MSNLPGAKVLDYFSSILLQDRPKTMLHGTPGIVVYKAKLGGQNRSLHTRPGDYNNLYLMKIFSLLQ